MRVIHKKAFPLKSLDDVIFMDLWEGATILSVGNQNDNLCVWYATNDNLHKDVTLRTVRIRIAGTGHSIDDCMGAKFLGTVQFQGGSLVFHIYQMNG